MCVSNYTMVKVLRWSKVWYHKLGFNHVVLFIIYFVYLLLGASLFYILEHESSVDFRAQWQTLIDIQRRHFVSTELLPDIFNNSRFLVFVHDQKSQRFIDIVQKRLVMYETKLRIRPPLPYLEWTFENSLAYCWSLITTIGYGYTYPVTDSGRVASVVYSIFGIPFTIVVIKDLAYLLARLLNYPNVLLGKFDEVFSKQFWNLKGTTQPRHYENLYHYRLHDLNSYFIGYIWNLFRYCTLQPVNEQELYKNLNAKRLKSDPDYRISLIRRLLNIPAIVAIFALIGWLSLGAFLFSKYETGISVSTSLYLLYNTLSTIGIGDVEPRKALTLTFMIPYVYVGLAIVSMFVNLLHAKFSRAYWLPEDNPLLKTEARMR